MSFLFDILLVPVVLGYSLLTQSTKVEESFNIQAIHDIIYHGTNIDAYDHLVFPGSVPRTFIGSIIIAALTKPWVMVFPEAFTKQDGQIVARAMLGLVNIIAILYLKDAAFALVKKSAHDNFTSTAQDNSKPSSRGKKSVKRASAAKQTEEYKPWSFKLWFTLFILTQFHIPFYASRTLPNFFALPMTNIAFAQMFKGKYGRSISILAFTAIVFRIEVVALMLALGLAYVLYNKMTIPQLIKPAITGAIIGAILSGVVDSYFWQYFTIPEIESFIFNVVHGRAAEWGTEPFSTYFTRYFVTMYLPPHVPALALLGYFVDPTKNVIRLMAFASFVFVMLISFQPHKEWRFVVYVSPLITLMAANGAAFITSKASKSFLYKLYSLAIFGSALVGLIISLVFASISSYNYPGGKAVIQFHETLMIKHYRGNLDLSVPITVHIDPLACMTGHTHFMEVNPNSMNIIYDKTENTTELATMWETFDYLITEVDMSDNYRGDVIPFLKDWRWHKLAGVKGFKSIDMRGFRYLDPVNLLLNLYHQKSLKPFFYAIDQFVHQEEMLFIYERVPAPVKEAEQKEEEEPIKEQDPVENGAPEEVTLEKLEDLVEETIEEVVKEVGEDLTEGVLEEIVEEVVEDVVKEAVSGVVGEVGNDIVDGVLKEVVKEQVVDEIKHDEL